MCWQSEELALLTTILDLRSDFLSEFLKPSIPVSAVATVRLGVVAEVEIQADSLQRPSTREDPGDRRLQRPKH